MWNKDQEDFIVDRARAAKAQILHAALTCQPYAAKPFVLHKIRSFADLHDLCDANTLGGWCDDEGRTRELIDHLFPRRPQDETQGALWLDAANESHELVNKWIVSREMARDADFIAMKLDEELIDCLLDESRWVEAHFMLDDLQVRCGEAHGFDLATVTRLDSFVRPLPQCLMEFPEMGHDEDFQSIVDSIPPKWHDTSWHNDAFVSFELPASVGGPYRLWISESDPSKREVNDAPRFTIVKQHEDSTDIEKTIYEGDKWDEVLPILKRLASTSDATALLREVVELFEHCRDNPDESDLIGDMSELVDRIREHLA
jgi:hypothetical protein